jgi:hypothetical protein
LDTVRTIISWAFMVIGGLIALVTGVWGFILCLLITHYVAGFWGIVLGLLFGPVLFAACPWYALFEWGDSVPLLLNYGGGIVGFSLLGLGAIIGKEKGVAAVS